MPRDPEDAAYKAVHRGTQYGHGQPDLPEEPGQGLVTDGKVSEAQIDAAVLPILEVKYELGLFDHPYVDESKVDSTLNRPEGWRWSARWRRRSMVLLKNENHTLPLQKTVKKIAVIGPLADSRETSKAAGRWRDCSAEAERAIR